MTKRVVNPNRKRKSEGMHPEIEKVPPHMVQIKMHTQGVNLSSEMIKEMGIRILEEMCPDEKKIHVTFSNGPFIDATRTAQEARRRLPSHKHRLSVENELHFRLR